MKSLKFAVALIVLAVLSQISGAIDFKHQEDIGVEDTFMVAVASVTGSGPFAFPCCATASAATWVVPGWMLDYQAQLVGGGYADFTVDVSTGIGFATSTSSDIFVTSAAPLATDVKGQAYQPIFTLKSLSAGSTFFLKVEYLKPRGGGF